MKNQSLLSRLSICLLAICVLFVSGCFRDGPPLQAAMVEGSRTLTEAEVFSRYAGNSVRFDVTGDAQGLFRETYFAKDGTFQIVSFYEERITEGTWETIGSPHGGYEMKNTVSSGIIEGKVSRVKEYDTTILVNVLRDGTARLWIGWNGGADGSQIVSQPKPTPGFQGRARFNEIKKKISADSP